MKRAYVKHDPYYWKAGICEIATRREREKKQKALRSTRALKQLVDKSANAKRWSNPAWAEEEKIVINYNTDVEESIIPRTCVHTNVCKHFQERK